MRRNVIETVLGAVVLLVAALFVIFAYSNASLRTVSGYSLIAKFDRVDGLNTGSDVKVSGIKVGTITGQDIDPQSFLAVVHFSVDPRIKLPADSAAEVVSDGLLGGKYLSLVPGADSKTLEAGSEVKFTQSPINLESLIGQLLFSNQKPSEGGDKAAAPADGLPGGTL
ncbi:MAG TPA: outer membrane lipid asymmetry maintenance protein MlaD [Alphaproteobacteria bacterium]|nr:outer membrane lipid asymmetry maintenance protein MlaD [Alphaproteobacteria bacterium]